MPSTISDRGLTMIWFLCRLRVIRSDKVNCWKPHIHKIDKKIASAKGMLSKLRHKVTTATLRTIYMAIAQSHLLYGIEIWGSTNLKQERDKIQRKQKFFDQQKQKHQHNTRSASQGNVFKKRPKKAITKQSIKHLGTTIWNKLPKKIKTWVMDPSKKRLMSTSWQILMPFYNQAAITRRTR